jgi:hypothetical protein
MRTLPKAFTPIMADAIWRDRKTETRRVIDFRGIEQVAEFVCVATERETGRRVFEMKDKAGNHVSRPISTHSLTPHWTLPIADGDRLWVRERWCVSRMHDGTKPSELAVRAMTTMYEAGGAMGGITPYRENRPASEYLFADLDKLPDWAGKMRPAMFMMPWQSRMTLIVEEVRVERLQEITQDSCLAEGAPIDRGYHDMTADQSAPPMVSVGTGQWITPRAWYHRLWDKLNAARGHTWESNPWVSVTRFSVRKVNFEALP